MHAELAAWAALMVAAPSAKDSAGEPTWGEEVPCVDLGLRRLPSPSLERSKPPAPARRLTEPPTMQLVISMAKQRWLCLTWGPGRSTRALYAGMTSASGSPRSQLSGRISAGHTEQSG